MLGGALLVFFGIALLSVRLVPPLAGALGWPPTKFGGSAGVLARENAQRNPQRTASTASALMIGLALVTLVSILAAGIISSFRGSVDKIWKNADYAITAQNNFSPIPVAAANAVAKTPGRHRRRRCARRRDARLRQDDHHDRRQPGNEPDVQPRLEGGLRSRALHARRRTARSSTRATQRATASESVRPSR